MGEVAVFVFKLGIRVMIITGSVLAFSAIMVAIVQMVSVGLNLLVVGDILSLIQMWLPFDLNVIFMWATTVTVAYVFWRLTLMAVNYVNNLIGEN